MLLTQDQDTNILMIIITHHIGTTIITIIVIIITIIITITTIREDQFITDQEDIDKKMGKFIISEEEKNSIRQMYNLNEQEENLKYKKAIQNFLNEKGITDDAGQKLETDGKIGNYPYSKTAQAIFKYQSQIGAQPDGVWGDDNGETVSKMKESFKKDYELFQEKKEEQGDFLDKIMGLF